ncbi:hypothetical protein, partial [Gluconobacter sp. Dm-44]|uniref:hypothetical protein n=1 Tax=Gluconobacter sp. Dm-44 TaxID=2799805 RepID=UPI001B8B4361
ATPKTVNQIAKSLKSEPRHINQRFFDPSICDIGRAHFTPCLVTKTFQIRDEPLLKIRLPVFFPYQPPSKLDPHELCNQPHRNPKIILLQK